MPDDESLGAGGESIYFRTSNQNIILKKYKRINFLRLDNCRKETNFNISYI